MSEVSNRRRGRPVPPRWAFAGALGGLAVVLAAGAGRWPSGPVESSEFVLRDKDGVARAALVVRPDGTPGLGLFDRKGTVRLSLDLGDDDQPAVNLFDRDGTLRAALAIRPDGTPGLGLFDGHGRVRRSIEIPGGEAARTPAGAGAGPADAAD